jgi:3-carboxy-cis,cis-muconate cycloisomerase
LTTFAALFVPADARDAVSDRAWLAAMLRAERALADASAAAGLVPAAAADAIAAACDASLYDVGDLAERGRGAGNPAEPLVRALRARVGGEASAFVHRGATSQDVLDTAAMLVARDAVRLVGRELDGVLDACARLAREHRASVAAARTLLQQAVPTTFGLRAAGWLVTVLDARALLHAFEPAAELGGAAGTLAALGDRGVEVLRAYAAELGLAEPTLPWHGNRVRVAQLAGALDAVAGALAKIATDVVLLAAFGEVEEATAGASSTMPQKRNPAGSTLVRALARQVHASSSLLTGGLAGELERAAGDWHAEWSAWSDALALTAGAAAATHAVLAGLRVDPERMRANVDPAVLAEKAALAGRDLTDAERDPAGYLGSADAFVDRALARREAER